jgi:hypothetical protein
LRVMRGEYVPGTQGPEAENRLSSALLRRLSNGSPAVARIHNFGTASFVHCLC